MNQNVYNSVRAMVHWPVDDAVLSTLDDAVYWPMRWDVYRAVYDAVDGPVHEVLHESVNESVNRPVNLAVYDHLHDAVELLCTQPETVEV